MSSFKALYFGFMSNSVNFKKGLDLKLTRMIKWNQIRYRNRHHWHPLLHRVRNLFRSNHLKCSFLPFLFESRFVASKCYYWIQSVPKTSVTIKHFFVSKTVTQFLSHILQCFGLKHLKINDSPLHSVMLATISCW